MNVYVRKADDASGGSGAPVFEINHPDEAESLIAGLRRMGGIYMTEQGDHLTDITCQFVLDEGGDCFCELVLHVPE